jgi:hypothetical protein
MASIVVVLYDYIAQEEAVFDLLAKTLDKLRGGMKAEGTYSHGRFSGRLKADMRFWYSFGQSRGLGRQMDTTTTSLDELSQSDFEELQQLLRWLLLGSHLDGRHTMTFETLTIRRSGYAWHVAEYLEKIGFLIVMEESTIFLESAQNIPRHNTGPLHAGIDNITIYCKKCGDKASLLSSVVQKTAGGKAIIDLIDLTV